MSNFPTRKSFKSLLRDKPRHSGKLLAHTLSPRKGGAGRGNVGRLGDEVNQPSIHPDDPNYASDDDDDAALYLLPTSTQLRPSTSTSSSFTSSITSYAAFKLAVKAAAHEYVTSLDLLEFTAAVGELRLPLFYQDIPYIIMKYSFDLSDAARHGLSSLLLHLYKATPALITGQHVNHSVTKLCYALPDLLLDVPNARCLLKEFASFFVGGGMLDPVVWGQCEAYLEMIGEEDKVKAMKGRIHTLVTDFMTTEEADDAVQSITDLQCPALHFLVIQSMIRCALDRTNRQRELVSRFLCYTAGTVFSSDAVEQAFSTLLQRVEDVAIDVPDALFLLSVFVARAIVDECLQPSFLSRVDVDERDLGAQVLLQAEKLLEAEGRAERLEKCWRGEREGRRGSQVGGVKAKGGDERKDFAAGSVEEGRDDIKR